MAPGRGRALANHLLFSLPRRSSRSSGTATTASVPPPRHLSGDRGASRQKARPSALATSLNTILDKEQQGGPAHRHQREVLGQQSTLFAAARFARRKSRRTAYLGGMRASAEASLAVSIRTAGRQQGARGTETSASRFLPPPLLPGRHVACRDQPESTPRRQRPPSRCGSPCGRGRRWEHGHGS